VFWTANKAVQNTVMQNKVGGEDITGEDIIRRRERLYYDWGETLLRLRGDFLMGETISCDTVSQTAAPQNGPVARQGATRKEQGATACRDIRQAGWHYLLLLLLLFRLFLQTETAFGNFLVVKTIEEYDMNRCMEGRGGAWRVQCTHSVPPAYPVQCTCWPIYCFVTKYIMGTSKKYLLITNIGNISLTIWHTWKYDTTEDMTLLRIRHFTRYWRYDTLENVTLQKRWHSWRHYTFKDIDDMTRLKMWHSKRDDTLEYMTLLKILTIWHAWKCDTPEEMTLLKIWHF